MLAIALLSAAAHAVFVLPESMTVGVRADPDTGVGYSDMVFDGVDTPLIGGGTSGSIELAFSDLISGPDVGLGDGLGSGVIVTVWGYGLGSTQGSSQIEFCDASSVCRVGHVYYWKRADGVAPSGPANLYESHGMYEVAFSIPDSASGPGSIRVTVGEEQDTLPFTVRAGNIYHVKNTGNNSNPGTFDQPWLTQGRVGHTQSGGTTAGPGSTVYFHNVFSGGISTGSSNRGIYFNNAAAASTDATMNFAYVAYPGEHSTASGQEGVHNYQTSGMALSKFRVESSNDAELANGQPGNRPNSSGTWGISTDKWGRVVGNYVTDQPGRCANRYQAAITGGASFEDNVSNAKILGNEIAEYGCYGSGALHHTTYMTIRSGPSDLTVEPWEFGWNYLHDNDAKSGIHNFDQDDGCGTASGPIIIRNNVVVNQAGPGIYFGGQCAWDMDVYIENNIVLNTGLPVDWDGLDQNTAQQTEPGNIVIRDSGAPPLGGLLSTVYVRNNILRGVGWPTMANTGEGCLAFGGTGDNVAVVFTHNICVNTWDYPYVGASNAAASKLDNVTGSRNAWYYAGSGSPTRAVVPTWDATAITTNPLLTITGPRVAVGAGSPVIDQSNTTLLRDIYGVLRGTPSNVGAVE